MPLIAISGVGRAKTGRRYRGLAVLSGKAADL